VAAARRPATRITWRRGRGSWSATRPSWTGSPATSACRA